MRTCPGGLLAGSTAAVDAGPFHAELPDLAQRMSAGEVVSALLQAVNTKAASAVGATSKSRFQQQVPTRPRIGLDWPQ